METASSEVQTPPAPKAQSFWEDLIDIFLAPIGVFRRWQGKSAWPPILFVTIATGVIVFFTFNAIEPVFDAEFTRNTAKAIAQNPQAAEATAKFGGIMKTAVRYGSALGILVAILLLGIGSWIVAKLVGAKQSFQSAMVVAGWAYMPRVLSAVLGGVQGLVMDPEKLTGAMAISFSPARFYNPDTTNPLLFQFLGRLDLFTIWVTILLAVGLYVTAKTSKGQAIAFGILIWFIGSLPALRTGYLAM